MTQNLNTNNSVNSSLVGVLLQNLLKNSSGNANQDASALLQPLLAPQNTAGAALPEAVKKLTNEAKTALLNDLKKVDLLVSLGRLNGQQGTNLKGQMLKDAFGKALTNTSNTVKSAEKKVQDALLDFETQYPNFFSTASRMLIKTYLKDGVSGISADELSKIADIVEKLETEAVTRYQQSKTQEKTALDENQQAKSRLESTAISAGCASGDASKVFSRKEIAAMPTAEFIKNESAIHDQIKKGLIAP